MSVVREVFSVALILFSVIDILGSLPLIVDIQNRTQRLSVRKTTLVAGALMVVFLFVGEGILHLFGTDVSSFAVAGAIVIFAIGMEMLLGIELFRQDSESDGNESIVPLAFPMIAGAGTLTTILSLKAEFSRASILTGIVLNLIVVYFVLRGSRWIESRLGQGGLSVLRKVFGIVLLSIAVKLFRANLFA